MRDNHEGMLEIVAAYERDSLFFGVVRVCTPSETASFEFGVHRLGFVALRRILECRPFGSMPGVKHSFYFTGSHSKEESDQENVSIGVRIEEGMNGKKLWFDCPVSLAKNLKWFLQMKDLREAAALNRVPN
jgi:hypothetical protein